MGGGGGGGGPPPPRRCFWAAGGCCPPSPAVPPGRRGVLPPLPGSTILIKWGSPPGSELSLLKGCGGEGDSAGG